MNIYEDTNPRELKELLRQIHSGDSVLPDFQRDFVWDPGMTMELIVSIADNYPAGSLLRIRNTQNLFAYREFQGSPKQNGHKPVYLVLDGQQRLTSLYQAFYGVGENRYYLNIRKLLEARDFDDCIFNLRNNHRIVNEYSMLEVQAKELILPLSVLKDGSGEYNRWVRNVGRLQEDDQARFEMEDALDSIDPWIQTIDDYKFPVVTLTDSTSAEAVCTIFETLNRTGVKLSPFELLTARFWHQDVNLRKLWADAKEKYPIIDDFYVDPYYTLQVIAMVSKARPSIKRNEVMNLEKDAIEKWWQPVVIGFEKALRFLQNECGVLIPGLLPYSTILIPLAAIFTRTSHLTGPSVGAAKDKIGRWFWCSVFGQKYESSPTSQSAIDFQEVIRWIEGSEMPESVQNFRFDPVTLQETTARQRAVYRGTLAVILRNQARDFYTHEILTLEVISKNHVDDHHVFPNKYLENQGVPQKLRDCVLNHTLIDRETNQRISSRAPSDYMQDIYEARGPEKYSELLHSHVLPSSPDQTHFENNDFEGFISWRQKEIWGQIKYLTGYSE